MLGLKQTELAEQAGISKTALLNIESGASDPKASTLTAIQRALEAVGVEFTNGSEPGVKLRKNTMKHLDERARAEVAKKYAREWTAYCKASKSMAFASAKGDLILVQYRRVDSLEIFNLLHVRVLEDGFEFDGKHMNEGEVWEVVRAALDSRPQFP
jgi:transcriptional regulator with XRE-family HTH domain